GSAFSGKALTDILAIGLVATNKASAGDEYHDRVRPFDRVHGLINVQTVARIIAVSHVAADLDAIASLLFEQGLVHRLREMQIEHGTARAGAVLPRSIVASPVCLSLLHVPETTTSFDSADCSGRFV